METFEPTIRERKAAGNNSYPASAAAAVFGGHLSAQAAFQLDRKSPRHVASYVKVSTSTQVELSNKINIGYILKIWK